MIKAFLKRIKVLSDCEVNGVEIRSDGRAGYLYIDGEKQMRILVDRMNQPDYIIYSQSIEKWLPPYESEPVTEDEKERILANMCQLFERRKWEFSINRNPLI